MVSANTSPSGENEYALPTSPGGTASVASSIRNRRLAAIEPAGTVSFATPSAEATSPPLIPMYPAGALGSGASSVSVRAGTTELYGLQIGCLTPFVGHVVETATP
jgi:hypothetical protein